MALTILSRLSCISTTSAASIVTSLPKLPIAIPISDNFITGASLMPSPTKAVNDSSFIFSKIFTLSIGSKLE